MPTDALLTTVPEPSSAVPLAVTTQAAEATHIAIFTLTAQTPSPTTEDVQPTLTITPSRNAGEATSALTNQPSPTETARVTVAYSPTDPPVERVVIIFDASSSMNYSPNGEGTNGFEEGRAAIQKLLDRGPDHPNYSFALCFFTSKLNRSDELDCLVPVDARNGANGHRRIAFHRDFKSLMERLNIAVTIHSGTSIYETLIEVLEHLDMNYNGTYHIVVVSDGIHDGNGTLNDYLRHENRRRAVVDTIKVGQWNQQYADTLFTLARVSGGTCLDEHHRRPVYNPCMSDLDMWLRILLSD